MKLPNWDEVEEKRSKGVDVSILEQFIYDYEPSGRKDAEKFLNALDSVVLEIKELG